MLKAVEFFRKRRGMPDDEFYDYWLRNHSRVVLGLQGLVRYTQNHPLPETRAGAAPPYDGVVEVWFESAEAMRRNIASSYWPDVVADEEKFIDRSSLALLLVDEHVVLDGDWPRPGVKSIKTATHRPGMAIADFQRHWREAHGPLVAAIPGVRRHVQNHVRGGAYRAGAAVFCDGYGATWFDSLADARASGPTPQHQAVDADEPAFKDTAATVRLMVTEHVIKA
jgi:uncharacterized protein (TIGR02118 family)